MLNPSIRRLLTTTSYQMPQIHEDMNRERLKEREGASGDRCPERCSDCLRDEVVLISIHTCKCMHANTHTQTYTHAHNKGHLLCSRAVKAVSQPICSAHVQVLNTSNNKAHVHCPDKRQRLVPISWKHPNQNELLQPTASDTQLEKHQIRSLHKDRNCSGAG